MPDIKGVEVSGSRGAKEIIVAGDVDKTISAPRRAVYPISHSRWKEMPDNLKHGRSVPIEGGVRPGYIKGCYHHHQSG